METKRQKKISKLILKDLSIIFQKESNQFIGNILVTITNVRISPDLSVAKIYLSLFPSKDPKESLYLLNKNKKYFRKLLGLELGSHIRIIPELVFYLDDSAEYLEEINRLIKK